MADCVSFRPLCFASPPFDGFAVSSKQVYSVVYVPGERLRSTLQYPNKFQSPHAIPLVSYWGCLLDLVITRNSLTQLIPLAVTKPLPVGLTSKCPTSPWGSACLCLTCVRISPNLLFKFPTIWVPQNLAISSEKLENDVDNEYCRG